MNYTKLAIALSLFILGTYMFFNFNQNEDNRIYRVGNTYAFDVLYYDATGALVKTDLLEMEVTDGFYPARVQTQIAYTHHQQSKDGTTHLETEKTGVEDSPQRLFIHPPREGDLHILSFASFPSLNLNKFDKDDITFSFEGDIKMFKEYEGITVSVVKTSGKGLGMVSDTLWNKPIKVYHIYTKSASELGEIIGNYYVHQTLGFVKLAYILPDKREVVIQLKP